MRGLKLLVAMALLAAFPAVAFAHRPANRRQRNALYRLVKGTTPPRIPERCLTFTVSTPNMTWADVGFNATAKGPAPGCGKWGFNGVSIFHFRGGRWRYVTSGSSFVQSNGSCGLRGVPKQVMHDLRLC